MHSRNQQNQQLWTRMVSPRVVGRRAPSKQQSNQLEKEPTNLKLRAAASYLEVQWELQKLKKLKPQLLHKLTVLRDLLLLSSKQLRSLKIVHLLNVMRWELRRLLRKLNKVDPLGSRELLHQRRKMLDHGEVL